MQRRIPLFLRAVLLAVLLTTATQAQFPTLQYDISVVEIKTGFVSRVTFLNGSGEFNPSWSNNGERIVHDVVTNTSHDLFVTEVATGTSVPLSGGDGGNDAVWSPNGQWIAFDRIPAGETSVYVLPASGGTRTLVVSDAIAPEWSQNSQRVVFVRPSNGSVYAIATDGTGEVMVTANGSQPSWSPNGQWVAFVRGADIWKVRVRHDGEPIGTPTQVTSGPGFKSHPTWSNNSGTIVFHSDADGDYDVWSVPASGGTPTKVTGTPIVGDFDPTYSKNGKYVAFASFTPLPLVCDLVTPDEHDFNDVRLSVGADGRLAYPPGGHGYFPRFACDQYLYGGGILVGGIVNGQKRVFEAAYQTEAVPSEIGTSGVPFRVFSSTVAADVANWPPEFRDGGGDPIIIPNAQNLVVEYNDINGPTIPPREGGKLNIEVRQRSLAYDDPQKRNAIIFVWEIVNRSSDLIDETYFSMWSDPDIGAGFGDDRVSGVNGMGIAWDNDFSEAGFVSEPAIVGMHILDSPSSAPSRANAWVVGTPFSDPIRDSMQYKFMNGEIVAKWGIPTDIRVMTITGPFDLAPGQSVTIAGAYLLGRVPAGTTSLATAPVTFEPNPGDPILADLLQIQADLQAFYDANLSGSIPMAPFAQRKDPDVSPVAPSEFALGRNFPNPFNPTTQLQFDLPTSEFVTLRVYSSIGEEVAVLVNGVVGSGSHTVTFDAKGLPSGVYFCRLQAGTFVQTQRLLLVK